MSQTMVAKCEHGSIYAAAIYGPGTHHTKQEAVNFVAEGLRDSDTIEEVTSEEVRLSRECPCWSGEDADGVS